MGVWERVFQEAAPPPNCKNIYIYGITNARLLVAGPPPHGMGRRRVGCQSPPRNGIGQKSWFPLVFLWFSFGCPSFPVGFPCFFPGFSLFFFVFSKMVFMKLIFNSYMFYILVKTFINFFPPGAQNRLNIGFFNLRPF